MKKPVIKRRKSLFKPLPPLNKLREEILRDIGFRADEDGLVADALVSRDASRYFRARMSNDLLKKVRPITTVEADKLKARAFDKFYLSYDRLTRVRLNKLAPFTPHRELEAKVMKRSRAVIAQILNEFEEGRWFSYCKHGPGTSLLVSYSDTSAETKFSSFPWSGSIKCFHLFLRYLEWDWQLRLFLSELNPAIKILLKTPYSQRVSYAVEEGIFQPSEASQATTVPKTSEIDRMIAIEGTLNMFFQQGLMVYMYDLLKSFGVDLATAPDRQRYMAYLGSITAEIATVDWEGASDSVLRDLVEQQFPPVWFAVLDQVRHEYMEITYPNCNPQRVKLPMMSTMGNATTFPVESIIFYSFMVAIESYKKDASNSDYDDFQVYRSSVGVFGDDCAMPSNSVQMFLDILSDVGMKPNRDKSYWRNEGFRESCGHDYFCGRNVRPVYIRSEPPTSILEGEAWVYKHANQLIKKYMVYFGADKYVYNLGFLNLFASWFVKNGLKLKIVPSEYPEDSGLQIFDDYERIIRNTNFRYVPLSQVALNESTGAIHFSFLRYKYPEKKMKSEHFRYYESLRKLSNANLQLKLGNRKDLDLESFARETKCFLEQADSPSFDFTPLRIKGYYSVARGRVYSFS